MWIILISVVIFLTFFFKIKKLIRKNILLHKISGPPSYNFIVGNMPKLQGSLDQMYRKMREWAPNYYPIYKIYSFHIVTVCILSPEDFELILSNPKHNTKSHVYNAFSKWLKTGLLISSDEKWQVRRKILTPAFHFTILQEFIAVFLEETDSLVEKLKEESGKIVEINPLITQFTLSTIAETAMGTKLDKNDKKEVEYKKSIHEIGKYVVYRLVRPWLYIHTIYYNLSLTGRRETKVIKILHDFTKNVIKERAKTFKGLSLTDETSKKRRLAMLDLLLSTKMEQGTIDDDGIHEEVDTFMFEGHDTVTTAICFSLMLISCHSQVQDRILEELQEVLGDLSRKPSFNDLQNMKYLERCIKESLRLYPSVHYISRILGEDLTTNSGFLLPKGTIIHMPIVDLHRNPDIFPDPETFDPDRFLPENCLNRHSFAYLPFSAGSRNCIGQRFAFLEMKTVLCGILRNFRLEPIDTPETIELMSDIVLRSKYNIKVRFVRRQDDN